MPPPAVRRRRRAGRSGRQCSLGCRCGFAGDEGPCRGAARRWRIHPSVVARAGEGARDSAVAFSDSLVRLSLRRGRGSGENECARVRWREPSASFVPPGSTRDHPMGMDGRRLTDRVTAQVGAQLSRPRPTMRPSARSALCASGPIGHFRFWAGFEL
jgi:hypothetical protein